MRANRTPRGWLRRRYFFARNSATSATTGEELDALANAIDIGRLSADQFVRLLETLHMLSAADAGVDLKSMSTDSLVHLVARASKEQLKALTEHEVLRPYFLDEIFERMAAHLVTEKVADLCIVVSWRFTKSDGEDGYDRYQTVIEDGICVSSQDLGREPDTTVTLSAYDFLRMATGNAAVASMFVTGKVKVKGDYAIAATFSNYFDIPKPY